jgi:hypothetical protein
LIAAIENIPAKTPIVTAAITIKLLFLFLQTFFQAIAVIIVIYI